MKTELILNYLREEGFCPKAAGDIITFKYQGMHLIVNGNSEDEGFLQIILPNIYDITGENKAEALEAANSVNRKIKVAKIIIFNDSAHVHFEILLDTTPDLSDIIPRALNILQLARSEFYDALN